MFTIVIWGVAFPFIKVALDELPPITLAAVRFVIASAFFLSLQFTIGKGMGAVRRLTRKQWLLIAAFGLIQSGLTNISQNIGMQWTSSGLASIIQSVGPIFAVTLAILFLGERYTHLKLVGGTLAVVGTVGIVTGGGEELAGSTLLGNTLMVVTAAAYAMGGTIAKYLLREVDPITIMAIGTPFCVPPLLAWAAFEPGAWSSLASASGLAWGSVLFLALLATGLTMVLWYRVLERVDLSLLSYFVFLIPVVSVVAAWAWLGETISVTQVLFAALLIVGVAVAQREKPLMTGPAVGLPEEDIEERPREG
jgi:drug/metabolite transporter (DMT)-like permease